MRVGEETTRPVHQRRDDESRATGPTGQFFHVRPTRGGGIFARASQCLAYMRNQDVTPVGSRFGNDRLSIAMKKNASTARPGLIGGIVAIQPVANICDCRLMARLQSARPPDYKERH
jgi:hypothetical protein